MIANLLLIGVMLAVIAAIWLFSPTKHNAYLILALFGVPFVICQYLLTGQRLRDVGLTGWLALLWFPVGVADNYVGGAASIAFLVVLCVVPGNIGENRYGPDPVAAA